jgi:hypothetical protein
MTLSENRKLRDGPGGTIPANQKLFDTVRPENAESWMSVGLSILLKTT